MSHVKLFTKAPREGASFITSQSELGVIGGGCGGGGGGGGGVGWPKLVPLPKGLGGFLDVQRKTGLL